MYFVSFVILFHVLFNNIHGSINVSVEKDSKGVEMEDFIKKLIDDVDKNNPQGYLSIFNKNGSYILDELLYYVHRKLSMKTIVIDCDNRGSQQINIRDKYLGYLKLMVILTNSTDNFIAITESLKGTPFGKIQSKFLAVLNNPPERNDLIEMFNHSWSNNYAHVSAIFYDRNKLNVFTYNSFLNNIGKNSLHNLTNILEKFRDHYDPQEFEETNCSKKLIECSNGYQHGEGFVKSQNLLDEVFYNKFDNLYGKPLNVLIIRQEDESKILVGKTENGTVFFMGHEVEVIRCMTDRMNATVKFKASHLYLLPNESNPWKDHNYIDYNAKAVKMRLIRAEQIDLINSEQYILKDYLQNATDSLYPYVMDNLVILIRNRGKLPYYQYLFLVFDYRVWIVFIVVFFAGVIGWVTIGTENDKNKLIEFLRLITGGSLPTLPTKIPEQIFVIFSLIYTMIILTAFTCNLTSVLTHDRFYPKIETMKDLDESGLVVAGFKTQIIEIQKAFNGSSYEWYKKLIPIPSELSIHPNDSIDKAFKVNSQLVWEFTKSHPIFINSNRGRIIYLMRKGLNKLYMLKESPLPNYNTFKTPLGSPYLDTFDTIFKRLFESGIYDHWKILHNHNQTLTGRYVPPEEINDKQTKTNPISVDHLQAAFLILVSGYCLSTFVFFLEIIWSVKCKFSMFKTRTST